MASLRNLTKFIPSHGRLLRLCPMLVRHNWYDNQEGVPRKLLAFMQGDYDLSQEGLLHRIKKLEIDNERYTQRYIPERHKILGPDLATSHFIVKRGGAVKFVGRDRWIRMDKQGNYHIPNRLVPGIHLEAVDASGTKLMYEGLDNFVELDHLRFLSFANCPNFDNWCLTRLHVFRETLEFLDLSGCPLITHQGLGWLHNLYNLKGLRIADMPAVGNLELMVLMLEEALPGCKVLGVDHQGILEESESYRLAVSSTGEEEESETPEDKAEAWSEESSVEPKR